MASCQIRTTVFVVFVAVCGLTNLESDEENGLDT